MQELEPLLAANPMFARLDPAERRELAARLQVVRVEAGAWAFRQGDEARGQYLVLSGRVELWREGPGGGVPVGSVGPGGSIGELGALTGEPHSLSVLARRDSELALVDRSALLDLVARSQAFATGLLVDLGRMLSGAALRRRARPARSVFAVVPLASDVGTAALRDAIVDSLRTWGSVAVWTAEADAVAEGAGSGDSDDSRATRLGRRLHELEAAHDFVVLEANPAGRGDAWTRFCTRQADCVIAVAGSAGAPDHLDVDDRLLGCELAFAALSSARARQSWFDALSPRAHHNIASAPSLASATGVMLRRLAGRSIGLVLSGGAARGLAHVGAIQGLLDAGVVIDRVGGTSMGAFVGALFALGHEPGEIVELLRQELCRRNPFTDFTVPVVSLARGRRALGMMVRLFGTTVIEDLQRDYFCVTADLATGEAVVHRRGGVIEAVGASMSIPGWAPPVRIGDRVLVDGGILDNFPIGVMAATDEGPVIGVDAMAVTATLPAVAGSNRRPSIMETLGRAATLGSRTRSELSATAAALVIRPDVGGIGLLDFSHLDRLFVAGRKAAADAISASGVPGG